MCSLYAQKQGGNLKQLFSSSVTTLFNNMQNLKFKGRPTNALFTVVNQMFGGSSQLTTTAEHCFIV